MCFTDAATCPYPHPEFKTSQKKTESIELAWNAPLLCILGVRRQETAEINVEIVEKQAAFKKIAQEVSWGSRVGSIVTFILVHLIIMMAW